MYVISIVRVFDDQFITTTPHISSSCCLRTFFFAEKGGIMQNLMLPNLVEHFPLCNCEAVLGYPGPLICRLASNKNDRKVQGHWRRGSQTLGANAWEKPEE